MRTSCTSEGGAAGAPVGNCRGFTLIRVLVALAVSGSLLGAASPNIATVTRVYSVRSGARQVYSDLQDTRMRAITENRNYTFTVDDGGTSYTIDGVSKTLDVASHGVTISAANPISFNSSGAAPTNGTITVTDTSGTTIQVAIGPAGRVRIQ
jgi:prepilin-type N-terminal cleavage/methylation domain-containing protein